MKYNAHAGSITDPRITIMNRHKNLKRDNNNTIFNKQMKKPPGQAVKWHIHVAGKTIHWQPA